MDLGRSCAPTAADGPRDVRTPESAIEKQPACAAPISSSGLVPAPSPKRDRKSYAPSNAPLPEPHVAGAFHQIASPFGGRLSCCHGDAPLNQSLRSRREHASCCCYILPVPGGSMPVRRLLAACAAAGRVVPDARGARRRTHSQTRRARQYSPADSMKTMQLEQGFRLELVASEPDVQSPVAMDIDEDGRLFVVEMPGYPLDVSPTRKSQAAGGSRRRRPTSSTSRCSPMGWCCRTA